MTQRNNYRTLIYWGTSTWTYPEWQRIVYHKAYTTKSIKAESLAEYAAFKPFLTVGIEHVLCAAQSVCARRVCSAFARGL